MSLFMLGWYPHDHLFAWNLGITIPLLLIKFFYYKYYKWHYFFTDFCYYGNIFIYIFIFLYPSSKFMYISSFAYATGPLAVGVITFWNSLVLHDHDKMSSLLIHTVPLKMLWSIHWFTSWGNEGVKFWNPELENVWFFEYMITPMYFFLIHHLFWIAFNFILKWNKIKEQSYENSFTYFANGSGKWGKLI